MGISDEEQSSLTLVRDYGVEGQVGLEPTLSEFLEKMLNITKELKRVLKKTGVMFWNHGDNYSASGKGMNPTNEPTGKQVYVMKNIDRNCKHCGKSFKGNPMQNFCSAQCSGVDNTPRSEKGLIQPKCLCLQNYRLILRMIDEQGWILRNSIIWNKPNHMPSSVKDRFSNSYEPVFMLTKNKKYWFDLDAVRVPHQYPEDVKRRIKQDRVDGVNPFAKDTTKKWRRDLPFKFSSKEGLMASSTKRLEIVQFMGRITILKFSKVMNMMNN